MSTGIIITILCFGIIQAAMLVAVLHRRHTALQPTRYLIAFLAVVALQLAFKVITKTWLWDHARTVYMMSYNLGYLAGPLLYLYIRSQDQSRTFSLRDALHFLPFIGSTMITLVDEVAGIVIANPIELVLPWPSLQIISIAAYGIAGWRVSPSGKKYSTALRSFLTASLITEAIIVITIALLVRNFQTMPDIRPVFLVLTLFILWLTYRFLSSPDFLLPDREAPVLVMTPNTSARYANSGLRHEERERIAAELRLLISDGNLFFEEGINIADVANRLNTSRHHLSQTINEKLNCSFTELVTSTRLNEAHRRLFDPRYSNQKISAIAYDLGFSSDSVFTTAFKKRFGQTPSALRRELRDGRARQANSQA